MNFTKTAGLFFLFTFATFAQSGAGAFATGRYRNLFAEGGHSQREISQRIDAAFQQLFHGDPDTHTVYYAAGRNDNGPLAYLTERRQSRRTVGGHVVRHDDRGGAR